MDLNHQILFAAAGVIVLRAEAVPQFGPDEHRRHDDDDQQADGKTEPQRAGDGGRARRGSARRATAPAAAAPPPQVRHACARSSDTVDLPGQHGTAFVEPTLQNGHRSRLVDDPTLTFGAHPSLTQRPLRADGRQPLVGEPHRDRRDPAGQRIGQLDRIAGRRTGAVRQGSRQTRRPPRPRAAQRPAPPAVADACRTARGGQFLPAWPGFRPGRWTLRRCARCPRRCRAAVRVRDRPRRADPAGGVQSPLS